MRLVSALAAASVVTVLTTAAPALATAPPTAPGTRTAAVAPAQGHEATGREVRALLSTGTPGALAVAEDSRGTWYASAGTAERGASVTPLPDHRFRAGSITKMFTATALVQLAAQGRLRLDDTVDQWLPGLVRGNGNDGRNITLRQLLNHTSGLYDYTSDPEFVRSYLTGENFLRHRFDRFTPQQLIATALAHHPYHAPGKGWNYSNTNYALAGLVIEKASGRTYAQQLRRTIIEPLGLRQTTVPGTSVEVPAPRLRGYSKLGENDSSARVHDVTRMSPTVPNAAGEIISTAPDLNRFLSALMSGRLVPEPWLRQMRTTVPLNDQLSYGLGLLARKLPCGKTVWGHGGQIQGYLSYAAATGDGTHRAAVAVNSDWPDPARLDKVLDAEFCQG
ncbi:serine hydrolase domain-containing protein [Streptomyces olivaceoviridis]|uniref:serine hydrolase domain-containing protein n=1 Tax=Streptomyces olivaceoviridis TaxID=1921 RepID=UPI0037030BDF